MQTSNIDLSFSRLFSFIALASTHTPPRSVPAPTSLSAPTMAMPPFSLLLLLSSIVVVVLVSDRALLALLGGGRLLLSQTAHEALKYLHSADFIEILKLRLRFQLGTDLARGVRTDRKKAGAM